MPSGWKCAPLRPYLCDDFTGGPRGRIVPGKPSARVRVRNADCFVANAEGGGERPAGRFFSAAVDENGDGPL
ncbi:hypothetical protein CE91St28_16430 [Pyramidobacter piscolens]|nr:hypothetical protein CE91St28_16430 [Pyramidobacter piscolens]